jgi:CRP-like cAMP-binding protein
VLMRTSDQSVDSPNQFLRSLSCEDRARLTGKFRRIAVEPGTLLLNESDAVATVYFPETVLVSIECQTSETQHVETAVVGYEGMVGWPGLLRPGRSHQRAIIQMRPGSVLAISIDDMAAACASSRTLYSALMCFVEVLMTQMAQAIVSHLRDSLECRLSRWLMMRHDRVATDQLMIRHDEIGRNLGARRAGVTDCLHILEGDRLIRCYRGRIIIRDRAGLEALAGESYGAAEGYYRAMIGPFGRSSRSATSPGELIERRLSDVKLAAVAAHE